MANTNEKPLALPKHVHDYSRETLQDRKAGDVVWACAFEFNMKKSALGLSQEPIRGLLSYTDCEASHGLFLGLPVAQVRQHWLQGLRRHLRRLRCALCRNGTELD